MSNGVKGLAALPILVACVVTAGALAADFVITQSDEEDIIALAEDLNEYVNSVTNPASSSIPFDKYRESPAYKKLLEYDHKLIPYLVRQFQLESESHVIVGSALADRPIDGLEDLYSYQGERAAKMRKDVAPWFDHFVAYCLMGDTTVGRELEQAGAFRKPRTPWSERFSWAEWWEANRGRFEFRTKEPLTIDTTHKHYDHPHISTELRDGLLYMEAVHATYPQMIERAAAETGVLASIGDHPCMDYLSTVRMRGVTFEEFAYLVGRSVPSSPLQYEKIGQQYHFGNRSLKARPRPILDGWGIMMERTVFHEGDDIPVVIITRGTDGIVDPHDPVFPAYGSFRVTTNAGEVVHDYREHTNPAPTRPLLQRGRDLTGIDLNLRTYCDLPPGEYNVQFRYGRDETPPIAIEVYLGSGSE